MAAPTAYDEVVYPGWPFPQAQPDRLATLAKLFGMAPADPAGARVLELGCGDGGNLLAVASAWPGARVVGIDLAPGAIARGRSAASELGLANLDLRCGDIAKLPDDLGEFDYVIAHGVYSWVPEDVRGALLDACRRFLAPQGVAFVSYNVYPGGHVRQMLREMLLMHVEEIEDPAGRCAGAREFLAWVADAVPEGAGNTLALEARRLAKRPDAGLFHDDLSGIFHLCYFRDFCAEADARGLQFLAEAEFFEMQDLDLSPSALAKMQEFAPDLVAREQYRDFLKERRFRQTLLCRSGVALRSELDGGAAWELSVSCEAKPDGTEVDPLSREEQPYRGSGGTFSTSEPLLKVALRLLEREWPRALPMEELLQAAAAGCGIAADDRQRALLGDFALGCYAADRVQLHWRQPPFARWPGPRPLASSLARLQVRASKSVTSLVGSNVLLDDPLARRVLSLLDGTRGRAELLRELRADKATLALLGAAAAGIGEEAALDRCLDALGRCALLRAEAATPSSPAGR